MSIEVEDLVKVYDDLVVVYKVSFAIEEGELFVLLGGSGSGKSTVLRMIAGLTVPDSGRIRLHGQDVTNLPPQARETGFVFQNYSLFRHMTVADNVRFGLNIRKVARTEQDERADELLELVGLGGLGKRFPDQLSGGQRQRVALARALAYKPKVLLLDEPFGALDVQIRGQLRRSLKEIQQRLKVTTILVTHDQEEAFELADRVAVLERGHLMELASPERLYHAPSTEFAANFVGGGNVLVGRAEGDHVRLGKVKVPFPGSEAPTLGSPVRLLIRPEMVQVRAEEPSPDENLTSLGRARVADALFAGPIRRLRLELEDLEGTRAVGPRKVHGRRRAELEAVVPSGSGPELRIDQQVWVGARNFHLLRQTGLNILICASPSGAGQSAMDYALRLATHTASVATLLAVVGVRENAAEAHARLQEVHREWAPFIPELGVGLRTGKPRTEILRAAQEGQYEVVALGRGQRLGTTAVSLLEKLGVSVLIVFPGKTPSRVRRILVCTAGGAPGDADIRMAARLGLEANARVTIFHAFAPQRSPTVRARVEHHLRRSQRFLSEAGVECEMVTGETADTATAIFHASANHELVILGAPGPGTANQGDLSSAVVARSLVPVLLVPLME